ncbi:hypothetical protein [Mucilaginibacter sp.]|uniref:hypothetical protein n=1 Tax=Mucilaginibacter sp. TaxID=1882438 RepID=UPI0035626E6F
MNHVPPVKRDLIATAFLTDIVITFPVAYYYLLIRPLKLKKWSIFLVISCCLAVAYFILPAQQRYYIVQLRKLSACIELGILIYCVSKIKKIRASYKQLRMQTPYNPYILRQSMFNVLGNGIGIKLMASELSILKFGLLFWKKQKNIPLAATSYSIYKESGYIAMFCIVLFACFAELMGFHLLIAHYSNTAAFIISLLTMYGIVIIVGDLAAIIKSPVLVMPDKLVLRTGIRWVAVVGRTNIIAVEKVRIGFEPSEDCFQGGILKSSVNICFTFDQPVNIERIYSKTITAKQIVMTVDKAEELIAQLA